MSTTTTKVLILTARANKVYSPTVHPTEWTGGSLQERFQAIPEPRLTECVANVDEASQLIETFKRVLYYQWISPPLDGDQDFLVTVDSAVIKGVGTAPTLSSHSDSGVAAGTAVVRIWEPSTGNFRGSSLIVSSQDNSRLTTTKGIHTVSSSAFSATVNALDGDVIVIEVGWNWQSAKAFDSDDHGPAVYYVDDDGKITFSKDIVFKDETLNCLVGFPVVAPLVSGGANKVLAPSCDNVMLGG